MGDTDGDAVMGVDMEVEQRQQKWRFWIDRGGTFTDVIALTPEGKLLTHKLLSQNQDFYLDAAVEGIRRLMQVPRVRDIPTSEILEIKMGTTITTNALLTRSGEAVALFTTGGMGDVLEIGDQTRPDLFALNIQKPRPLTKKVVEVETRCYREGALHVELDTEKVKIALKKMQKEGVKSIAVAFMHSYANPENEQKVGNIARQLGFPHISLSHDISPTLGFLARVETTVAEAYLNPLLQEYVKSLKANLQKNAKEHPRLYFMQSEGNLVEADRFRAKDSILSGPAGGVVGAVKSAKREGFDEIIGFDMGGTSTDVCHYSGALERVAETHVAAARLRTPMLAVHTIAAGGGSLVSFKSDRLQVGPESAGASPGPVCYGVGDNLTVTDCNVLLGRIQADDFPKIFGPEGTSPMSVDKVKRGFQELKKSSATSLGVEELAQGYLDVTVSHMANAIKKISLQKGIDPRGYTLVSFGGAGGQHACLLCETLGIKKVYFHPTAGLLSAFGIGFADLGGIWQRAFPHPLNEITLGRARQVQRELEHQARLELAGQMAPGEVAQLDITSALVVRSGESEATFVIPFGELQAIREQFRQRFKKNFGFLPSEYGITVAEIQVEAKYPSPLSQDLAQAEMPFSSSRGKTKPVYLSGRWQDIPVVYREEIATDLTGPAVVLDKTGTNVLEEGWKAYRTKRNGLVFEKIEADKASRYLHGKREKVEKDPIQLEIFNNLLQTTAEQMGFVLQKTSRSVNIKERLDFSCAIFDKQGGLVANAPHIPVHLGSMQASVESLIQKKKNKIKPGQVYLLNDPYAGGTHLPDLTVITPYFVKGSQAPELFVASRGHHADIGGVTPGSMPAHSSTIHEEGALIDLICIMESGSLLEKELKGALLNIPFPTRNYAQNKADILAQVAANQCGIEELEKIVNRYGLTFVNSYMEFIQENARQAVESLLPTLKSGSLVVPLENGSCIQVAVQPDTEARKLVIDFTGTSPQAQDNFNAPAPVVNACILYVIRLLLNESIPLNNGCLKPVEVVLPEGTLLSPRYPAAVVAGNVETSQRVVDALLGAMGQLASSHGTMNNLTFGNPSHQYYETICGGMGAGPHFAGADAVQCHMTNSRMTDPEVLENRYPVLLSAFSVRKGSGGKGVYKGGDGVKRKLTFLASAEVSLLTGQRKVRPFGLSGGEEGQPGVNRLVTRRGDIQALGGKAQFRVEPGDAVEVLTPGGGGFGKPASGCISEGEGKP